MSDTDEDIDLKSNEAIGNGLKDKSDRRQKIIAEILHTEQTYQHHLDLIVTHFEQPLIERNILPLNVLSTIFSNVQQIISVNRELSQHLRTQSVGKAFLQLSAFLKLYSTYANNHEAALACMLEWDQKSAEFAQFRRQQEEHASLNGLKLNALLITPVQRVPRYKLLLEDLLNHTPEHHEDYEPLKEATQQVSAVASHINEHIRQHDNFKRMVAIQKSFEASGGLRILVPGRSFVKEGQLNKVSRNGSKSHQRTFFLFSDIMLYAKPRLLLDSVTSSSPSYSCCCILPLQHCRVTRLMGRVSTTGALFSVTCKKETLFLYADKPTVDSWVSTLQNTIRELRSNRRTLRRPSSANEPMRREAIGRMSRLQRKTDRLSATKKTDKTSPGRLKNLLQDVDMNCLSAAACRRRAKRVSSAYFASNNSNVNNSVTSANVPPHHHLYRKITSPLIHHQPVNTSTPTKNQLNSTAMSTDVLLNASGNTSGLLSADDICVSSPRPPAAGNSGSSWRKEMLATSMNSSYGSSHNGSGSETSLYSTSEAVIFSESSEDEERKNDSTTVAAAANSSTASVFQRGVIYTCGEYQWTTGFSDCQEDGDLEASSLSLVKSPICDVRCLP